MIQFAPNTAHILSWLPEKSEEVFYLSPLAKLTIGTAVRGGVPICWPWFGPKDNAPSHGFARTNIWELVHEFNNGQKSKYVFHLPYQVVRNEGYPEGLQLEFVVEESDGLTMKLTSHNKSKETIEVTQALHSYFRIGNVDHIEIDGLNGTSYFDKVNNTNKIQEGRLRVNGEVDRIYWTDQPTTLVDPILKRKIIISKSGSMSTVVWNPGKTKSSAIADLPNSDYKVLCCIEAANTHLDPLMLQPGASHTLMQTIRIEGM